MDLFASTSSDNAFNSVHDSKVGVDLTINDEMKSLINLDKFCTKQNINQCMAYLSQELAALGFPSIYSFNTSDCDTVKLLNATYELLHQHLRENKIRDELERRNIRISSDLNHMHASQSRLKDALDNSYKKVAILEEKERQLLQKIKTLQTQLKSEKEEVKKLNSIIQQRHAQYHHELRKKEREITQLKERLGQLLTDKNLDKKCASIDIINTLSRTDGQRGKWKTGVATSQQEEELYNSVISSYVSRLQILQDENACLRDCLEFIQEELVSILNQKDVKVEYKDNGSEESSSSLFSLPSGYFQMPFSIVGREIEESLKENWKCLKDHLKQLQENHIKDNLKDEAYSDIEEAKLKKQIEVLKENIKHYEEALKYQNAQLENSNACLKDEDIMVQRERLTKEKQQFIEQKNNLEKEKKVLMEVATKVEEEKKALEDQKVKFLRSQLMKVKIPLDGKNQLYSSPVIFTKRDGQISVPNTPELNQVLGLSTSSPIRNNSPSTGSPTKKESENAWVSRMKSKSSVSNSTVGVSITDVLSCCPIENDNESDMCTSNSITQEIPDENLYLVGNTNENQK